MNNQELNDLLRRAHVPERTSEEWNQFARDTARRIHGSFTHESVKRSRIRHRAFAAWGVGFATVCVLLGFAIRHWHARREARRDEIADARKLFSELSALFPNQIEAVILNEHGPRLILAEQPLPRDATPLFVRICGAKSCERVITFSGRRVPLNGQTCEVLLDARGNVIVAGERFVWTSADHTARAGYKIEAAQLSGAL